MTREQQERLTELLELIRDRLSPRRARRHGARTLREAQTFDDVSEALELLAADREQAA